MRRIDFSNFSGRNPLQVLSAHGSALVFAISGLATQSFAARPPCPPIRCWR